MWQLQGFGRPVYLNSRYPFPVDPPRVPDANGIGDYRLVFDADPVFLGGAVLAFDGIDSTGLVALNGEVLGWTKGSRLTHEFDVAGLLRERGNVLEVRVAQFNAGSYLEAQDQWRLSGIFRDVALLAAPPAFPRDIAVQADYDPRTGDCLVSVRVEGAVGRPAAVTAALDGRPVRVDGEAHGIGRLEPWTAERPVLHELLVSAGGHEAVIPVGFRRVEVAGGLFRVNGRPIRFKGVNRHDFDARRGRAQDAAAIERDLVLMKRAGINAIRTSHYPPQPALLDAADRLGFWVVEECDVETHGFEGLGWAGNPADDLSWEAAIVERVARMVGRDRNHPSVVMWSLGNESGAGRCLRAAYDWCRAQDPSRPVHYEGDRSYEYSDVVSHMYTPVAQLADIVRGVEPDRALDPFPNGAVVGPVDKPFVLCEYAHAMGAGPGGLADYEALFDAWPRLQGGFVWQWQDQNLVARAADGREYLAYGGDFGDEFSDAASGNGLTRAFRETPAGPAAWEDVAKPGLADYAAVIAAFRVEVAADGSGCVVTNRQDFADAAGCRLRWRRDGASGQLAGGVIPLGGDPGAGTGLEVALPAAARLGAEGAAGAGGASGGASRDRGGADRGEVLTVVVEAEYPWWDGFVPLGVGQAARGLDGADPEAPLVVGVALATGAAEAGLRPGAVRAGDRGPAGEVATGAASAGGSAPWEAAFAGGLLETLGGVPLTGPRLGLWRAPTDNDLGVLIQAADSALFERAGLSRLMRTTLSQDLGGGGLATTVRESPMGADFGVELVCRWAGVPGGARLRADAAPYGPWPADAVWARVGLDFELPGCGVDAPVRWRGLGPGPAGPDSGGAALWGWHRSTVANWQVNYSRPQDGGVRGGVTELAIGLPQGRVLVVVSRRPLWVSLRPWTDLELSRAAHPHELPATDRLVLHLDAAEHGLGTGSCGQSTWPPHRLHPVAVAWDLRLAVLQPG
jgi:beta-galactosidase